MNIGAEEVKKATKSRGYITRVRRTSCCAAVQREKDHSDHRATALEDDFDDSDDGVSGGLYIWCVTWLRIGWDIRLTGTKVAGRI